MAASFQSIRRRTPRTDVAAVLAFVLVAGFSFTTGLVKQLQTPQHPPNTARVVVANAQTVAPKDWGLDTPPAVQVATARPVTARSAPTDTGSIGAAAESEPAAAASDAGQPASAVVDAPAPMTQPPAAAPDAPAPTADAGSPPAAEPSSGL